MASVRTKPSTPRLSEAARHVVIPSGITTTGWPAVRDKCADLGITFDPWQDGAGRLILSKRADGTYAASIGGVVISIPRQVGKTFLLGAIVFALCLLNPGLTVIWTAHRARTAGETFQSMQGFARRRKIAPHVDKIVLGSGEEEIRFTNGSRVLFGARERGFGRGFTLVGVLVFDEAQILTENAIDDMVPATNQAENPLLLFTGTPPKPSDPSEVFRAKRTEALSGESDDTVYIEFSADDDADPLDRKQWAKANPSFPKRTPDAAVLRMKKNLTLDSFLREAMGIWDTDVGALWNLTTKAEWQLCRDEDHHADDVVRYAVAVGTNSRSAAVGVSDGTHLEVAAYGPGTSWLADWLKQRPHISEIWMASTGPAGAVIEDLAGVTYHKMTVQEQAGGLAALLEDVRDGKARHIGQEPLDEAVAGAVTRRVDDVEVISRSRSTTDTAPLEAVMLARLAAVTHPAKPVFAY